MLSRLTSHFIYNVKAFHPGPPHLSACSLWSPRAALLHCPRAVALFLPGELLPVPVSFSLSSGLWDSAPSMPLPLSTSSAFPFSWPFLSSYEYALVISTHKNTENKAANYTNFIPPSLLPSYHLAFLFPFLSNISRAAYTH